MVIGRGENVAKHRPRIGPTTEQERGTSFALDQGAGDVDSWPVVGSRDEALLGFEGSAPPRL